MREKTRRNSLKNLRRNMNHLPGGFKKQLCLDKYVHLFYMYIEIYMCINLYTIPSIPVWKMKNIDRVYVMSTAIFTSAFVMLIIYPYSCKLTVVLVVHYRLKHSEILNILYRTKYTLPCSKAK